MRGGADGEATVAGFHPVLQDEYCGHLVDDLAAPSDGHLSFSEQAIGLGRGQTFIPMVHGEFEAPAKLLGEKLHLLRLNSFLATHAQGVTYDNLRNLIFADDMLEFLEVKALILALKGFEALRGQA